MKRIVLIMTAAVLMGTTAMAQGNNGQRPQFDRTEMIKQRTDAMVEKYKLDADQAKKLLELNTKNAETMGPGMGMGRMGGGRRGGMGGRRGGGQAGPGGQGAPQMGGGGFQMTEEQRAQFEEMRKQREENQKKYRRIWRSSVHSVVVVAWVALAAVVLAAETKKKSKIFGCLLRKHYLCS